MDLADARRENSLYAFVNAYRMGYRYLETDIHVSADGTVLAFHDDVVDRVTYSQGSVDKLTDAQLRDIRIDGIDPIPTLDSILEEIPDAFFNIDIKVPEAIAPLAELLRRHNAFDRVCVASFNHRRLQRFRRLVNNRVATSASTLGVILHSYAPLVTSILHSPAAALQIPAWQHIAGRRVPVVTKRLLRIAQTRGMKVHVWTINQADEMERLIDMGVDGIISDDIATLKKVASAHNKWVTSSD